jgi:hypothetical protein
MHSDGKPLLSCSEYGFEVTNLHAVAALAKAVKKNLRKSTLVGNGNELCSKFDV